jgi:hypothetical protein
MADDRELDSALARLISEGTLDPDQARRVHEAVGPLVAEARGSQNAEGPSGERVVEVLAYIGGALVLAAVGVVAALLWDDIGTAGQTAGCLAATGLLLGAALALGGGTVRRATLRSVLAAIAACSAGLAGSVIARVIADDELSETAILGGAIGLLVVAIPAYVRWRGKALVAACFAGGWMITLHTLSTTGDGWDGVRPLVFFGAYGLVAWSIGWLIPERDFAISLALGAVALAAAITSINDDAGWWTLGVGIGVIVTSFALFAKYRYGGLAAVGAVTALFVPAVETYSITDSAVAVAVVLSGVGLVLIAGAVLMARTRRGHEA